MATIRSGVISATRSKNHPYAVVLPVGEKCQRINYFIYNESDIPYELRKAMDCGESVAGVFDFVEGDQFATYCPDDDILLKPSKAIEMEEDK